MLADRPLSEDTFGELRTAYPGVEASWRDGYVRSVHGVPMSAGAETPEEAADDWLLLWGEVFGAEGFDYDLDWTADAGEGLAVVRFDQVIDGVNVDGGTGRVVLRQTEGLWQPVMAWCNSAPLGSDDLGAIIYGSGAALILAQAHEDAEGLESWSEPELSVYAHDLLGRDDARLAWKVLGSAGLMGAAASNYFFVDTETGGILGVRSGMSAGTIDGTVDGYATPGLKPNTTSNPPTLVALEDATVEVAANNVSDLTDALGEYSLTANFSTPVTVGARLEGPTWKVQHPITTTNPTFELTDTASSLPATVDFTFNIGSSSSPISVEDTAVVNGHVLAFEVSDYYMSRINGITLPDLLVWPYWPDSPYSPGCGGFYSSAGTVIFFLPSGSDSGGSCIPGCYRSFFAHEFAHAIADKELGGEYVNSWAEGFGDTLVVVMYDTGIFGEDFYGSGNHLRTPGTAGVTYPACGTSYEKGELLSGIWYDLIQELGHSYSQSLHVRWTFACDPFERPAVPGSACDDAKQPADLTTIVEVLTADDDNSTLADGTPNQAEICGVFAARGITHPTYCP